MAQHPVFETPRLILRDIAETDAPAYEEHFVDYEVIGTMSHMVPWPYPKNGVLEYIRTTVIPNQRRDQWVWGICLKSAADELIGAIWLKWKGTPSNRGFWLGRKFWRQGIMREALSAILTVAFESLGLHRVEAVVDDVNEPSKALLRSLGFTHEGTLRQRFFFRDRYWDEHYFGLLRGDWRWTC